MSNEVLHRDDEIIDIIEATMLQQYPIIECPISHNFVPYMYIREITMPEDAMITSMIHDTEHPFVVTKGIVCVWTADEGWQIIEAPYKGITKPGTRRILVVVTETVWTTYHVDLENSRDVDKIEARIMKPHENIFLPEEIQERIKELHRNGLDKLNNILN